MIKASLPIFRNWIYMILVKTTIPEKHNNNSELDLFGQINTTHNCTFPILFLQANSLINFQK